MTFYFPHDSSPSRTNEIISSLGGARSPLRPDRWRYYLADHPDQELVRLFIRGIEEGFATGYCGDTHTYRAPTRTLSHDDTQHILTDLERELKLGRISGPYTHPPTTGPYPFYRTAPTYTITKKQSHKKRRIDNLSFPAGHSVNDNIDKKDFPVNYSNIDKITQAILEGEPGDLVSCIDIKDAYRHYTINPWDLALFVIEFLGMFFLQLFLNFGCTANCGIFDTGSHLITWMGMHHRAIKNHPELGLRRIECILDDFSLFHSHAASLNRDLALLELNQFIQQVEDLGFKIQHDKTQAATTTPTIMGLQFDTTTGTVTIPDDKCERYRSSLDDLFTDSQPPNTLGPRTTTIARLRELLGKLVYVTNVVYSGRTRLYHLFRCLNGALSRARKRLGPAANRMKTFPGTLNLVHISTAAQDDLHFWRALLLRMPSRLLLLRRLPRCDPVLSCRQVTTDASSWGVGGYYETTYGESMYFSIPWNSSITPPHSTYGELFALIVAVALWDYDWKLEHILWITDCSCHTTGLYKIRTTAPELLAIHDFLDLRSSLGFYQYAPRWIKGEDNTLADELSRGILCNEALNSMTRCHPTSNLLPISFGGKLCY